MVPETGAPLVKVAVNVILLNEKHGIPESPATTITLNVCAGSSKNTTLTPLNGNSWMLLILYANFVLSELKYPYIYKVFIHGVLKKSDLIV